MPSCGQGRHRAVRKQGRAPVAPVNTAAAACRPSGGCRPPRRPRIGCLHHKQSERSMQIVRIHTNCAGEAGKQRASNASRGGMATGANNTVLNVQVGRSDGQIKKHLAAVAEHSWQGVLKQAMGHVEKQKALWGGLLSVHGCKPISATPAAALSGGGNSRCCRTLCTGWRPGAAAAGAGLSSLSALPAACSP
jgi:hypothetical protein